MALTCILFNLTPSEHWGGHSLPFIAVKAHKDMLPEEITSALLTALEDKTVENGVLEDYDRYAEAVQNNLQPGDLIDGKYYPYLQDSEEDVHAYFVFREDDRE